MFVMSPNDNQVSDRHGAGSLKDRDFGGNRKIKPKSVQKSEDYKKPSQERRANLDGEVEEKLIAPEATIDIDDLNDPNARKREASRRAETSTTGHDQVSNPFRRPGDADDKTYSDKDNRPEGEQREDDVVREPNPNKKHGPRNPWRIGEDYDRRGDQNLGHDRKPR